MNLAKVFGVARREFVSTACTKGFILGALVLPALMLALIPVIAVLAASATPPPEKGTLLVLDRSGQVFDALATRLSEETLRANRAETIERISRNVEGTFGGIGRTISDQSGTALDMIPVPEFMLERLPDDADVETQKQRLRDQIGVDPADPRDRLLGVVEIASNAAVRGAPAASAGGDAAPGFGGFTVFFRPKLNQDAVSEVREAVEGAIRQRRFELAGVDRALVNELSHVGDAQTLEVTEEGEREDSSELVSFIIPVAAMLLILVATFTGGQYLLTTTIEEKSSRVVEVLLSAVSPMELMSGKILGQMGVGLSLLLVYNSVGIVALVRFGLLDLIDPMLIVYFLLLFVLAYAMFASMMAAIGSAVNDLREAQALMTPVMLISMTPYFFFMPVIRSPNSTLSTVMSFIPPISPFIVIMRVASTDPPPAWQVWLAIAVMVAASVGLMWVAAKVFRVGLLMFGKPPNLATLIKWVRMA